MPIEDLKDLSWRLCEEGGLLLKFKERMNAILHNEEPDKVPFMTLDVLTGLGSFERELRNKGLGFYVWGTPTVTSEMPNVTVETRVEGDIKTEVYKTPIGSVRTREVIHSKILGVTSIMKEWMIKDEADYDVVVYMIDDTVFHENYAAYYQTERQFGDDGIVRGPGIDSSYGMGGAGHYLGLENWTIEQYVHPHEFGKLLKALDRRTERLFPLVADSPAELIGCGSTCEWYGPKQFEEYDLPFYEKYVPRLHARRKICIVHGHSLTLKCLKDLMPKTGLDAIDSFTPPPIGNLSLAEAIAAWGDKFKYLVNIPDQAVFTQGVKKTREYVIDLLRSGGSGNSIGLGVTESMWDLTTKFAPMFKRGMLTVANTINKCGAVCHSL